MGDPVPARTAFRSRNAPFGGSGPFEHQLCRCTGPAEGFVEIAHRSRPVGILVAVFHIADGLLDPHPCPVGFQFIGCHHREGRADPRPHFRAVGNDDDLPRGFNAQVDIGRPGRNGFTPRGNCTDRPRGHHPRPEDQGSCRKDGPQKSPAPHQHHLVHGFTSAASLMAWRIR